MKKIILLYSFIISAAQLQAQNFIDKAVIEYEVKTSIKKTMGSGGMFEEALKEKLPDFKIHYYHLSFDNNKSIYRFHHKDSKATLPDWWDENEDENGWYADHNSGISITQKMLGGSPILVQDSILKINWKLSNESRMIAGFNCRKATGIIMDSVYVFAFYSEELLLPGGPCNINGLPGTILGLTIPRLYSSWIATSVSVNNVNSNEIKPYTAKKTYTRKSFEAKVKESTQGWYDADSDNPEENKSYYLFLWNTLL